MTPHLSLFLGYFASALVFVTFWMRTPVRLRQVAIASNVAFFSYGVLAAAWPIVVLHAMMLPLNIWRLREMESLVAKVKAALAGDLSMDWLRSFMHSRKFSAGEYIFHKGDPQTDVLYIVSGIVRLPEIEVAVNTGELLGEMAIFSPTLERSLSALCVTDVEALHMPADAVLKLYYQNHEFGLYLVRLITRRLFQDMKVLGGIVNERTAQLERLRVLTDIDEGTGIANGRGLDARLRMEWTRAIRTSTPLSLVVVQIEGSFPIREGYDDLLAQAAIALGSCASRGSDFLARHDDAFVMILPGTPHAAAQTIADKMARAIAHLEVPGAGISAGELRMRSGVATTIPQKETLAQTLLYEAYRELVPVSDAIHRTDILQRLAERAPTPIVSV